MEPNKVKPGDTIEARVYVQSILEDETGRYYLVSSKKEFPFTFIKIKEDQIIERPIKL